MEEVFKTVCNDFETVLIEFDGETPVRARARTAMYERAVDVGKVAEDKYADSRE
jgi:hypothetical protein